MRQRLKEGRLQVAVLGQFKRGKSSFLNALLGADVLPTGIVPLTAIATFIMWGRTPAIRATFLDHRSEELAIADTGELRHQRHNTDAAIEVLAQCDVGLFVLSADPPITEAELGYLRRIRASVARLFFVINKIDLLSEDETRTSLAYLRHRLAEHLPTEVEAPVFSLSARLGLAAQRASDPDGLETSGLAAIERHLVEFLAREKASALQQGVAAKAAAVLNETLMEAALHARSGNADRAGRRCAGKFAQALEGIERQRLVVGDLLNGDRRRAAEMLEEQAAALRQRARRALLAAAEGVTKNGTSVEVAAKNAVAAAIPAFFEAQLAEMSTNFRAVVDTILKGHVERVLKLIATVHEIAAALFEIPSTRFEEGQSFAIRREPYWVTQRWSDSLNSLAGGTAERLLPAGLRAERARARLAREVDELVARNVENLRWATLQNLDAAFRRFAAWLINATGRQSGPRTARSRPSRREAIMRPPAGQELQSLRRIEATLRGFRDSLARFTR